MTTIVQRCEQTTPIQRRILFTDVGVWEMFANVINPLISAKGIPERLEFLQIEADGQRWLEQYTEVFDAGVTPYVHIIGKHVARSEERRVGKECV